MIYPGSEYALKTPISTLRLESIREGNEDYEYLWMFEQKINEINAEKGTDYNCDEILQKFFERIFNGVVPKTDSAEFKAVRSELLQLLEKLYSGSEDAIESLNKLN